MNSNSEDRQVIDQVLAGEPWRFSALVERYERPVFLSAFSFLRNRQDAEDVTQEVFVAAFRRLASFEGRSSFLTWLRKIVFNQCVDLRRKKIVRHSVSLESNSVLPLARPSDGPAAIAQRKDLVESVQRAIDSLSDEYRHIILLRDVDGIDYSEIASILEIPIGTVRSRLHRARSELKLVLESRRIDLLALEDSTSEGPYGANERRMPS